MSPAPIGTYVKAWLALLVLLALTCGSAYVHLGALNLVTNLAIAAAKAAIVLVLFMQVARGPVMVRVAALAGVAWLAVLVSLSLLDLALRLPAPGS